MPLYIYNIKKSLFIIYTEENPSRGSPPPQFDDTVTLTAPNQLPDGSFQKARQLIPKSPTARPEKPDSSSRYPYGPLNPSRRAFRDEPSGHCSRAIRAYRRRNMGVSKHQQGRIDGATWAYRRKLRYALVEASRRPSPSGPRQIGVRDTPFKVSRLIMVHPDEPTSFIAMT